MTNSLIKHYILTVLKHNEVCSKNMPLIYTTKIEDLLDFLA